MLVVCWHYNIKLNNLLVFTQTGYYEFYFGINLLHLYIYNEKLNFLYNILYKTIKTLKHNMFYVIKRCYQKIFDSIL